jgi:D-glycero-D-manno-heptose 1,7-bisphosphate phosphatase
VFLDRDGTVSEEVGYLNHLSRFRLLNGAAAAIRRLNQASLPVIVVTNQSGVGRGYFPEQLVRDVHDRMNAELAEAGARLDGVYYCPHAAVDECECRKPKIGMLKQAARELGLDLKKSFVVGDRYGDIELAKCAGARSILVRTGYGEGDLQWHGKSWAHQPQFVAVDLPEAVEWILKEAQR